MTKSTIDVRQDLETWLRGEVEKPCELLSLLTSEPCGRPAAWLMYAAVTDCGHHEAVSRLICQECREMAREYAIVCGRPRIVGFCDTPVRTTWIEPITST
jgi:hypothetical protein